MAADIKKEYDIDSELTVGSKGIFDVVVDGNLIFSKDEQGRFPENEEIIDKLRSLAV